MKNASEIKPFGLRLPKELRDWVSREAERERRSMNGQLIAELEARRKEKESCSAQKGA